MAAPKGTLWPRDDHTEGKHLVLEEYLKAWFPILGMGHGNGRILFIDGFAGPGEYADGEEGSPVVAMRVLAEHAAKHRISTEVVFVFIENHAGRVDHLRGIVDRWRPRLPDKTKVHVLEDSFESRMTDVLQELEDQKKRMAPALVMMDPFGIKDIPLSVIRGILGNRRCEVYVTFMWEEMNRFLTTTEFEPHMDALFGTAAWRQAAEMVGSERRRHLYALYKAQLKSAGAEHVVHFHLYKGNGLRYSVFFATGHPLGSDRMKKAIWKIAPFGDFSFRGGDSDQMVMLGIAQPDYTLLTDALHRRFGNSGWVRMGEIVGFVQSDETIFHDGHVKRQLKSMEQEGRIKVDPTTRKRALSYPAGCRVSFLAANPTLF